MDHVTSVIAITVCKVIRKLVTQINFQYQTDVNKRAKKVYLILKIYSILTLIINITGPDDAFIKKVETLATNKI